jgi:hypothetical protein
MFRRTWTVIAEGPRTDGPGFVREVRSRHCTERAATRRASYQQLLSGNQGMVLYSAPARQAPGAGR